ncbi:MAG: PsbP-related protein [Patescibacteria group bacterium]
MKNPNNRGFTPITILIVVLVAVMVGTGGYVIYKDKVGNTDSVVTDENLDPDENTRVTVPVVPVDNQEVSVSKQSITVLSPNGKEYLTIGRTAEITWQPGNAPVSANVVSIQLMTLDARNSIGCPGYQAGTPGRTYDCRYYSLFNDVPNNGSISWNVGSVAQGSSVTPGVYYVRIYFGELGMGAVGSLREQGYKTEDYSDASFILALGPVAGAEERWVTYKHKSPDFSFSYPSNYNVQTQGNAVWLYDPFKENNSRPLTISSTKTSKSLKSIIDDEIEAHTIGETRPITIGGISGYEVQVEGLTSSYGLYLKEGLNLIIIGFNPSNRPSLQESKEVLSPVQKSILASFEFND